MRLKHIHIAGFKSFVDPVTIPAASRLTGIVGPNGCGKSNVIDAVRWVLGESKARELRGASMQDVIFNGSVGRKPASRASVELLFDNSEGRAAGQWSQYAEISVKRVLTRTGDSSYWINNVQVRKRDMADLFLGTGLGGDAYAIIEQGMISRIIEAKPEELRGFLEEAAGVSKYKERRRETESRLRDTRENLARVSDIRAELARQLEKLVAQAAVARRYLELEGERKLKTQWLALLQLRDSQARQSDLQRQLDATRNEIEASVAALRSLEADLEARRLEQFAAAEALDQAQAHFYAESSEVTRVEQELRHLHATRERLSGEIRLAGGRRAESEAEHDAAQAEIEERRLELVLAEEQAAMLAERAAHAGELLPETEAVWREAQALVSAVQQELTRHEQARQVEEANQAHAERNLEQHRDRELRLLEEQKRLGEADADQLERRRMELEAEEERVERLREYLEAARSEWPQLEAALRRAREALDNANRELHRLEAEVAALVRLQAAARQAESEGAAWLERLDLSHVPRLWQRIRVEEGWETAVEAALGEAMAALTVEADTAWMAEPPEARFELLLPAVPGAGDGEPEIGLTAAVLTPSPRSEGDLHALAELIHTEDPSVARFLADRLALAFATDTLAHALDRRDRLPDGAYITTRDGHRVSRATLVFNAPEKGHHGLLARAREIEALQAELERKRSDAEMAAEEVAGAEQTLHSARRQGEALNMQLTQAQEHTRLLQVELVRGQEAARRVAERRAQIARELDELYERMGEEEAAWNDAVERQREAQVQAAQAKMRLDEARAARQAAEQKLHMVREGQRRAEREAQEAAFLVRSLTARLQDLEARKGRALRTLEEVSHTLARLEQELAQAQESPVLALLDTALEKRRQAESALTAARENLEGTNAALRELEAERFRLEHALEPLKEKLMAQELKLREAQLHESRHAEALAGIELQELEARAQAAGLGGRGETWLKNELARLETEIAGLGAVNMAALDELAAAEERKQYLDAQAEDLETAANTLEEAIRRIDAETRARLKDTYERVSREFKDLFAELFGGGEAQLILTGEEILDAGLSVLAQPPGKRNSSIHLLSGGEKALTALSLVFAFFRLNPAPFCLLDEVDAPLDDSNTERYCSLVRKMSAVTQFLFITHNRITMEMAHNLVGVTMPEPGVSRPVAVDVEDAVRLAA